MMRRVLFYITALACLVSCSTTKLVPEGRYRLASNKVEVTDSKINPAEVTPYIRQQANKSLLFGWNPMLSVYNWSDGSGKGVNRMWEKLGVAPVIFDPLMVGESKTNIANHLAYIGYYHADVEAEVSTKDKMANVKYIINPGERYQIGEVIYDVPSGEFAQCFYADTANITVKKGSILSESLLEAESVRGATYFRNLGFYDFNKNNYFFEADTLSAGKVKLYYRIRGYTRNETQDFDRPITKYTIGEVSLHRPAEIPFKDRVLKRYNTIKPGLIYNETMVNNTYNRFSSLKVFNNVSVEMTPTDSSTVNCDIRLSGARPMGVKANLEASSNSSGLIGISPQINLYHKNIFHGGEWLNIGFTGNFQFMPRSDVKANEFGVTASLSLPQMLGLKVSKVKGPNIPRTEFKLSLNYQNRPEYRRTMGTFSYGYTGQISTKWSYQIYPVQINLSKVFSLSQDFAEKIAQNPLFGDSFKDHIDAGLSGVMYYRSNPDVVPKTSYTFANFNFDLSGNLLSLFNSLMPYSDDLGSRLIFGLPYSQYVKSEVAFGHVFRFGRRDGQALAFRLDAGIGKAYGNSVTMPWEKMLYCGGANSMRGWQARTLGPGFDVWNDMFIIPSQVGDLKLEADVEYRFNMFWKLEGALFAEAGNVWLNDIVEDIAGSIAGDWGLGLRVNLDFILLRLDAGFRVHDPARPAGERWLTPASWFKTNGYAIHFGVGYPF